MNNVIKLFFPLDLTLMLRQHLNLGVTDTLCDSSIELMIFVMFQNYSIISKASLSGEIVQQALACSF